jgi:hypothetical protein
MGVGSDRWSRPRPWFWACFGGIVGAVGGGVTVG